jgi:hypothetical protein
VCVALIQQKYVQIEDKINKEDFLPGEGMYPGVTAHLPATKRNH